ncbi:hypothetical protein [Flavobacterium kingsejongi]|uniref:FabZ n=1 Tax=Flavobacterium kingsejongi TaxID=1678728 RepID=A0A2S1LLV1_9FLAO|nr:hypothetical protein [Flavobacterium kingsejongi]AWG24689.1 hypothetical protein FK004_05290 [Flavobacterium kingsejongi]
MESLISQYELEKLIPQKKPFVMVGQLFAYAEDNLVSGFQILEENIFSENGYFSESGIIEHMAQSVALHTGYTFFLRQEETPTGYIGSIKDIEIITLPKVGSQLVTTVKIIQEFMGITLVEINVHQDDSVIAKGSMKTVLAK